MAPFFCILLGALVSAIITGRYGLMGERVSENESPVLSEGARVAFYREQAKGLKGDDKPETAGTDKAIEDNKDKAAG